MKSGYKRKLCISGVILTALLFEVVVPKLGGAPMPWDALIVQVVLGIPAVLLLFNHSKFRRRSQGRNQSLKIINRINPTIQPSIPHLAKLVSHHAGVEYLVAILSSTCHQIGHPITPTAASVPCGPILLPSHHLIRNIINTKVIVSKIAQKVGKVSAPIAEATCDETTSRNTKIAAITRSSIFTLSLLLKSMSPREDIFFRGQSL